MNNIDLAKSKLAEARESTRQAGLSRVESGRITQEKFDAMIGPLMAEYDAALELAEYICSNARDEIQSGVFIKNFLDSNMTILDMSDDQRAAVIDRYTVQRGSK